MREMLSQAEMIEASSHAALRGRGNPPKAQGLVAHFLADGVFIPWEEPFILTNDTQRQYGVSFL